MTATSLTTPVVSLLVVVVLFSVGVRWWKFRKDKLRQPPTRPSEASWRTNPSSFDPHGDEWESMAPYPEHAVQAVHDGQLANRSGTAIPAFRNAREPTTEDVRKPAHDLREAWASFQDALEEEVRPASSIAAGNSTTSTAVEQVRCPRCLSSRIDTRNLARKAGSTIGSVAGATGAMTAALAGAETGALVGSFAGPAGTVFGGLAGAAIAGLVGSAAGCAAGSVVGAAIDDNVLDNHLCLACGHAFSVSPD